MSSSSVLLAVEGLTKHFPIRRGFLQKQVGAVRAVDGVSFTLRAGEILGLVGESGSGKSTVARMLAGSIQPTAGSIVLDGRDVVAERLADSAWFKSRIQMVFQDPTSSLNPRRTVWQSIGLPLRIRGMQEADRDRRIVELLEQVGLSAEYGDRYPHALSGGQKQRVAIARALAMEPKILVLDEPTSALDVSVQAKIIQLLLRLKDELDLAYVFITHDLSLMRNLADRTAVMYLGKIVERAATPALFENPLHPYTQMLLSAIPVVSEREEKLRPDRVRPQGEIPNPADVPAGCSFHTRCPFAMEQCRAAYPSLVEVEADHWVSCYLYPQETDSDKEEATA